MKSITKLNAKSLLSKINKVKIKYYFIKVSSTKEKQIKKKYKMSELIIHTNKVLALQTNQHNS